MILRLALFFFLLIPLGNAAGDETGRLFRENRLLSAELELAKKNANYCIIHLGDSAVTIKARGTELRKLQVLSSGFWGTDLPDKAVLLSHRTAFSQPEREKIDPERAQKEAQETEIKALELQDMPSRYTLTFEDGITVTVSPRAEGFSGRLFDFFMKFYRAIFRPLITLWKSVRGRNYTQIDLRMDPEEAKALYWALPEGTAALFYPPAS